MDSIIRLLVLSGLVHAAYLAPLTGKEESVIFFGEDFHIYLPPGFPDVVFHPIVGPAREEVLMKAGVVQSPRAKINRQLSHFILENVGETDEGLYTVTFQDPVDNNTITKSITLIVRDCSNEHSVKYGETFNVPLAGVNGPITVEFRPIAVEANQTSRPALVLLNKEDEYQAGYESRLFVSESRVSLQGATGADEGSYTILDGSGKVQKKVCLNVKELQNFFKVPYGGTLKFNLVLNSSLVRLLYIPDADHKDRVIMEKGELMIPEELGLQDRFSVDGSICVLEGVKSSDAGVFKIVDLDGYLIANNHLQVEAFKLPPLYVTIIALIALVVLLLLICLLACLVKVRKRAEKARALEKIAKHAGQEEGDAFRQVVKDACKQAEDANVQSLKEDITEKSQSTEVSIKGLEVSSKEVTAFDKNLETSDSGVGFNTTALPLDSDTEAPTAPLHDDVLSTSVASEAKPAPTLTPEPKPAPPPTPEPKASPPPQPKPAAPPTPTPEPKAPLTQAVTPTTALTPTPESKSPAPKSPAPEIKAAKPASTPPPEPKAAMTPPPEAKPAVSPTPKSPAAEPKPSPTAAKPADEKPPTPDAKPPVSPSPDHKLTTPEAKPVTPEAKPPASPEPKATLTPTPEAKPDVSPTLQPKSPTPDPKPALSPTPDPKPAASPAALEPTTNGTPEPKGDSESPKIAPPKSPETGISLVKAPPPADVSSDGAAETITNDSAPVAEEAATT